MFRFSRLAFAKYRQCQTGRHSVEFKKKDALDSGTAVNRIFKCAKHQNTNLKGILAANNTWSERHKIAMEDVLMITYFFSRNLSYEDVKHAILQEDGS